MTDDIRLHIGFFTHPKTKKLRRRHGETAVICLLRLWMFAAQHRSKGVLHNMQRDDIVDAAEWLGDAEFVDSLREFGFLDHDGEWFVLHDWRDHNGYAYFAEERSRKAREAAEARWNKKSG